jgi:hypothetical protein
MIARSSVVLSGGNAQFDALELPDPYFNRIDELRDLVELYDREIVFLDRDIHRILCDDAGYNAVRAFWSPSGNMVS